MSAATVTIDDLYAPFLSKRGPDAADKQNYDRAFRTFVKWSKENDVDPLDMTVSQLGAWKVLRADPSSVIYDCFTYAVEDGVFHVHPYQLKAQVEPPPPPAPTVNGQIQFSVATVDGAAVYTVYVGKVTASGDTLEGALLAFAERVNVVLR